jgi:peptidoglycan hydrolase-like protein with peptidoglycan-binding domain
MLGVAASTIPVLAQSEIFSQMLGIAINEAVRQQQLKVEQQNGGRTQAPALPKSTVVQMQRQLNALGYPAGKADGVMGRGTRQALAMWQADNGLSPTGELTQTDWDRLMSQSAAAAPSEPSAPQSFASSGSISLLYDTDLPQNDYRSGMVDPALKRITLDQCVALCEADGQCRAFTYNSKARVCFLKDAAASPERFSGAVSGIKGDTAFVTEAAVDTRLLTPAEIAELQAALNARGYDTGKPDGRLGRKTREAITAFARDFPQADPRRIDVALLLAVTGTGVPAQAAAFTAEAYPLIDDVKRQLALIAIARNARLIADDETVKERLRQDARSGVGPDSGATYAAYDKANEIERAKLLEVYRAALIEEAKAYAADPANATLRIRIEGRATVGAFEPSVGLRVGRPDVDLFTERKLDYRDSILRVSFVGIAPDVPDVLALPMADEAAASSFLDRVAQKSNGNTVSLVAYLSLSNFGTDANISGGAAADADDIPVTVKLDRLALVSVRGRDEKAAPGGEELAALVETAPATVPSGPADAIAVAQSMGLPILGGRVAIPGDTTMAYEIGARTRADYNTERWRYFNLAALGLDPSLAKDGIGDDAILALMTSSQRLRVFGDRESTARQLGNEFERRRALETFNEQVVPELVSRAPAVPIPVVAIRKVQLGEYDFGTASFPLSYAGDGRAAFLLPGNIANLQPAQFYGELPQSLPIDEATAERMVGSGDDRAVYLATFGSLEITVESGVFRVHLSAESTGIYRDLSLTNKVMDIDPKVLLTGTERGTTVVSAGLDQALVDRFKLPVHEGRILFVPDDFPGRDALVPMGALLTLKADMNLLDNPGMTMVLANMLGLDLTPYIIPAAAEEVRTGHFTPNYGYWAGADEFEREDSRKRFVADHRAAIEQLLPELPLEIAVLEQADLSQYDAGAGGFPIYVRTGEELTPYTYDHRGAVADIEPEAEQHLTLSVDEDQARAFREKLRGLSGTQLDPSVFGVADVTVDPQALATITTYRVASIRRDNRAHLSVVPLTRKLYSLSDLTTPLADLPFPEAPPPPPPEEVAMALGSADAPHSRFDMLGITLGMSLDEARKSLEARFEGKNAIPLRVTTAESSEKCRLIESRLLKEVAAAPAEQEESIRESYFGDFLKEECPLRETTVLELAFGYDVPQDDGTMDRVAVFKATQSGDIVGAVAREVPPDMLEAMTNGLIEKYGRDFLDGGNSDAQYRWWVEDPSMSGYFNEYNDECQPVWPELDRLPRNYISRNCGAFVRQLYSQVLLIDTRYNAQQYQKITEWAATAIAAEPPPMLDF